MSLGKGLYPNVLIVGAMLMVASIAFSVAAGEALQKAAFLFGIGLAPAYLTIALSFARKHAAVSVGATERTVDPNIIALTLMSMVIMGCLIAFIPVSVFTDMVVEGVVSAVAGSAISMMTAFTPSNE